MVMEIDPLWFAVIDFGPGMGHTWEKAWQVSGLGGKPTTGTVKGRRRNQMELKFRHKVFLAFFLNSLMSVTLMLLIGRHYAHRNFEDYVSKVEAEKLQKMADALSQEYKKTGNWSAVVSNWGHWRMMAGFGGMRRPGGPAPPGPFFPPPPPFDPSMKEPPFGEMPPMSSMPLPGPRPGPNAAPRSEPNKEPQDIAARLLLFDSKKRPLTSAGQSADEFMEDDYRFQPISLDNQVVGWLGVRNVTSPVHPLDEEFLSHISQVFYSSGGVALALAFIVTFILSRHLLGPVKELARGARALASRKFDTRIPVQTRDELGRLATDFNTMAEALERHEWMRRQWIVDISHELRTPLAILRAEIEAMQDGVREVSREALESLHSEVLHLGRIVHDLHDISLIESRSSDMEVTAVELPAALGDTLKSFQRRFEQRGIRIDWSMESEEHITVMADPGRMRQLFSNILENTLRYAHAPGSLKISRERSRGGVRLHIEDSGPGVPEEALGRLFDRLYRVDKARSRAQGGSGLGLAICKSIVESFGGAIEASNSPSGGLRITIFFPVLEEQKPLP
ncbi:MAG: ATP-binding protein [Syntrophobacteraceae bacterium]